MIRLAVVLSLLASPAAAAMCGEREALAKKLDKDYGEQVRMRGIVNNGRMVMELWTNPEEGTWTVTVMREDGALCLLGTGRALIELERDTGDEL